MNRVRVLPEILANKIAAGEIVERPASVAKELVENSLDAGARSVLVSVRSGGKKQILVRDDGEGMIQDDAILAFEHHATSKLQTVEDLASIATLGFRGEALPSIASVSRLTLRTRARTGDSSEGGTEVEVQGGILRRVKPVPWDQGTEVTVGDLFFNVPARRKFLRTRETELGHITRLVTQYALAYPEVRFTLESDGRRLIDALSVSTLKERVYQLFGESLLENLVEISGRSGEVSVRGFGSRPHEQRTNAYSQFFFVNRRMVRDKVIASAVRQAYRHVMPGNAYPVVLMFVELPCEQVDVNAHPAKTEIRFHRQGLVHDLIRESIERALVAGRTIPDYSHPSEESSRATVLGAGRLCETPFKFTPPSPPEPSADGFPDPLSREAGGVSLPAFVPGVPAPDQGRTGALSEERAGGLFEDGDVRILGQMHDSYIIASDRRGLLIIDQHVAHERILYERFAQAMKKNTVEVQNLLVPLTLELAPHQATLLERILPDLNRNGFEVERFGGNSLLVRSIPAVAGDSDCRKLLMEILEGMEAEERTLDVDRILDRIAVSTACHAAVKVHMPLTMEKMRWLLDELSRTRIPTRCPHGRPVLLRFSIQEIEKNFGRA